MDYGDALEVIRQAERIVSAAGWHLQEQDVLWQLANAEARPRPPGTTFGSHPARHL